MSVKGATHFFTREYIDRLKQAVKTGIAAIASLYLARLVKMPESYWAAISAIIVMYSDVGKTVSASWNRLIGTAIGVSSGGVFAAVFGPRIWAFGVAVTLTMLVCTLLGFAEASRLAGVAVAIVMLVSHPGAPLDRCTPPISRSLFRNRHRCGDFGPALAGTNYKPNIAVSIRLRAPLLR